MKGVTIVFETTIHKNMDEALKFALENGTINMSCIRAEFEMKKRNEYLKKHKWVISQGKDGFWRTYVPDKKKKRRMIKKRTKKEIEDAVAEYYRMEEEKAKTFDDAYKLWRKSQDQLLVGNSIVKYNTDYKRYFEDNPFSQRPIDEITEEEVKVFIVKNVKKLELCKKACKTLFGYVKNTFYSARLNRITENDPMEFLQAKQFYPYCVEIEKDETTELVTDREMQSLYQQFYEDYRKKPAYTVTYAVHFATLTGMRVGEISALTWDSITEDRIIVDKSEKYDRLTKQYYIDKTKNKKKRIFPLTDEINNLLLRVKKIEMENGFFSEWIFSNENGRIHAPLISSCSKTKCKQVGITERGIHAYRKTLNSKMRCDGVSSVVAAALLGHSPAVNEQYYTFDVCSLKDKAEIITNIEKHMKIAK